MFDDIDLLRKKQHGLNLIETVLVIAIVAILCTIAIPHLTHFIVNRDLKNAARDIVGDIFEIKHRALSENTKYRMKFDSVMNNYEIWRCGNSGPICNNYSDLIVSKSPSSFKRDITIHDVAFGGSPGHTSTFQTRGTATPGHIILKNGLESTATIKVNISGRTYVDWKLR